MWNLGKTNSAKPLWNHGKTLVEPSAEPFGSPKRICPREPWRVRKQFCPEPLLPLVWLRTPKLLLLGKKSLTTDCAAIIRITHGNLHQTCIFHKTTCIKLAFCFLTNLLCYFTGFAEKWYSLTVVTLAPSLRQSASKSSTTCKNEGVQKSPWPPLLQSDGLVSISTIWNFPHVGLVREQR